MSARGYLLFCLICFFPALAVLGYFVGAEFLLIAWGIGGQTTAQDLLLFFAIFFVTAMLTFACYRFCALARTRLRTGILVYLCWLLLGFIVAFLLSAAMAGVSMAVVEGVVGGWDLLVQELFFAAFQLALAQVIIIPWTVAATMILDGKRQFFFG